MKRRDGEEEIGIWCSGDPLRERGGGLALVERDEHLLLAGADNEIGLPIAKAFERIDDSRAVLDRDLAGNGAASFAATVAFPARFFTTQGAMRGAAIALVSVDTEWSCGLPRADHTPY